MPIIALVGQDVKVGEDTFIHPAIAPALVMSAAGRAREIHPLMWGIAPFFVAFFAADWLSANVF